MKRARSEAAKDARRHTLLAAALDEFFERGLAAARMDDIARRAGLSKGALYLYFDSKEALFKSIIDGIVLPDVEQLSATLSTSSDPLHTIPALMRVLPSLIRSSNVPKIIKILIAEAQTYPDLATVYRKKVVERMLTLLVAQLEQAGTNKQIQIGDASLTARLIVAPVVMSVVWHVVFEHDDDAIVDLDALFDLHSQMLVRAMSPARESTS